MCGKVVWKFRAGLGGSCSQLSAGSCTRSELVVVTSSSLERQPLSPKHQPVWHWACLNRDPFAFQVQHNKQQQRGEKWVINREVVVVLLHCETAGIQLCHPTSPGQGEGLGKLAQKPLPGASLAHHHSPTLPSWVVFPAHSISFGFSGVQETPGKQGQPWAELDAAPLAKSKAASPCF